MSPLKSAPIRQCKICRTRHAKAELSRWTAGDKGFEIDESGKKQGRGVYTCSPECTDKLMIGKKR